MYSGAVTKFNCSVLQLGNKFCTDGLLLKTPSGEYKKFKCGKLVENFMPLLKMVSGMRQCVTNHALYEGLDIQHQNTTFTEDVNDLVVGVSGNESTAYVWIQKYPEFKICLKIQIADEAS